MRDHSQLELLLKGYGLTTARILYHLPDHPHLLQTYVWQDYDIAPRFPVLIGFIAFWKARLEGPLHSVEYTHSRLIAPLVAALDREGLPLWGFVGIDTIVTSQGPRITALRCGWQ